MQCYSILILPPSFPPAQCKCGEYCRTPRPMRQPGLINSISFLVNLRSISTGNHGRIGRRPSESNNRCVSRCIFTSSFPPPLPSSLSTTGVMRRCVVFSRFAFLAKASKEKKKEENAQDVKMAHTPHIELSQGKLPTSTTKRLFFFCLHICYFSFMRSKMEKALTQSARWSSVSSVHCNSGLLRNSRQFSGAENKLLIYRVNKIFWFVNSTSTHKFKSILKNSHEYIRISWLMNIALLKCNNFSRGRVNKHKSTGG